MRLSGAGPEGLGRYLAGARQVTRWECPPRPAYSGALSAALSFVVVFGIELNGAESLQNAKLLAALDVFGESGGDRFLLCLVTTSSASLLDQTVVQALRRWEVSENISCRRPDGCGAETKGP